MENNKSISDILSEIQSTINVAKSHYNDFGKYHYRTLEDIKNTLKKFESKYNIYFIIDNNIIETGGKLFIESTASINRGAEFIKSKAYAEIPQQKKGMDSAQLTGAVQSYAGKYAIQNLLNIDDGIDNDSIQPHNVNTQQAQLNKNDMIKAFGDNANYIKKTLNNNIVLVNHLKKINRFDNVKQIIDEYELFVTGKQMNIEDIYRESELAKNFIRRLLNAKKQ